jgi:photosystem II stability/assembly factor-like uncharacterized protein
VRAFLLASLLAMAALAGCSSNPGSSAPDAAAAVAPTLPGFTPVAVADLPTFADPLLVDDTRAGGEPVIAITHAGTVLVSAHPGFTHYHPSSEDPSSTADLATPFAGQSYLWRSTDDGATWTHIGLPGREEGPRSAGLGVSDPEFTVREDGAICFTDLENLALSSTSCSTDDGQTWLPGNPAASGGPNDRQWLASYKDEFYFTANYFVDHHLRASTDKGLTWEDRGDVPCSGDLVARPSDGHLLVGCGPGVAVSADGGRTWSDVRQVPGHDTRSRSMAEPAVDGAGNVWVTWAEDEKTLWAAGSPDEGKTWPWVLDLTPHFRLVSTVRDVAKAGPVCPAACAADNQPTNGTYVWPWISAGSEGRIAVTWFGSYEEAPSNEQNGPWYVFDAIVVGAGTPAPSVVVSRLTPAPMHEGPICQAGTTCQVDSVQGDPNGDRRLGDFFETTIGMDGRLHGVWSNTHERPNDVISHVQYVRQTGGLSLIADADLGTVMPTQG